MTSSPATDLREHYALFQGLLNTAMHPREAFLFGDVPGLDANSGETPTIYALVDVQRRHYSPQSLAAHADVTAWVVSVRGVGPNVDEAAWVLARAADALEGAVIRLDGEDSTPLTFDTHDPIAPDGGAFSGLTSWTYVL